MSFSIFFCILLESIFEYNVLIIQKSLFDDHALQLSSNKFYFLRVWGLCLLCSQSTRLILRDKFLVEKGWVIKQWTWTNKIYFKI